MWTGRQRGATSVLRQPGSRIMLDVAVIGASQSGLAAGRFLRETDLDFCILERSPRVGATWRARWDSLRLFTPAAFSSLPSFPFPAPPRHLPSKDEVADYLEAYAQRFAL